MKKDIDHYVDKAMTARAKGYNCCQSVVMAYADELGLTEDTAAKIGAGLGAGVGGTGEICGVAVGMGICRGMCGSSEPGAKAVAMKEVNALIKEFESHHGHIRCKDLKGSPGVKPCDELIEDGVRIFYNRMPKAE